MDLKWFEINSILGLTWILPLAVSFPAVRATLSKAEKKCGGAERLGVDVIVGFVRVDVAVVIVVDGLINVFVAAVIVERLFAAADVKFPFACARIWATSGETSPNENVERLGVTVLVVVVVKLFVETTGIFVVVGVLLFTDVTLLDIDDEVSYIYIYIHKNLFFLKKQTKSISFYLIFAIFYFYLCLFLHLQVESLLVQYCYFP